jgi:superfamily II DNA/RNA helicase
MPEVQKKQSEILEKLGIEKLNPMQVEALDTIAKRSDVVLLSPTGSGKTLAFLLPIIESLDPSVDDVQALIIVPSRELAIQIEQVARAMGSGFKVNAVYGGITVSRNRMTLKHPPAILIGTPGRLESHINKETFSTRRIKTVVLDEFDKSLEAGFEEEMSEIMYSIPFIEKRILTSATQRIEIPSYVGLEGAAYIDYLADGVSQLKIKTVPSPAKDKLETLQRTLQHIGNKPGIVFCNYKESIERVSTFLTKQGINHETFHGGMEQIDRERALVKFRNGTTQILLASDLAARGIDIPAIEFIIHYQLPKRSAEFTHRNGRTARMNNDGTAYVLHWKNEELPEFVSESETQFLEKKELNTESKWKTIFISGGRKDKISKGDIVGLFIKQGKIEKDDLGIIEIKDDCAFAAVIATEAERVAQDLNNSKLKKKKVRLYTI